LQQLDDDDDDDEIEVIDDGSKKVADVHSHEKKRSGGDSFNNEVRTYI